MPAFTLDNADATLIAEYEEFVATSPYGHMMQSVGWSKVKDTWNADYVYLRDENSKICAALSILSISNDGGESSFMYAPRGPVCDIADVALVSQLLDEAKAVIEKRSGFLLRFDPEVPWSQELVDAWSDAYPRLHLRSRDIEDPHAFSNPRMNMVVDLTKIDPEDPISGFAAKTRNEIRKTYKSGVSTRSLTSGDPGFGDVLDEFFRQTGIMAERQGITHRPKEYFERLFEAFPATRLYISEHESGLALSTCIVVPYAGKAFYIYSASTNDMREARASAQMNFVAIEDAIKAGMDEYDMGGIFTTDDGLYTFKKKYCGEEGLREILGELDLVLDQEKYAEFTA